tara:strand:+ start:555 stop:767 length:213 start_codon:yes stop_codon:yes gene_type:complete
MTEEEEEREWQYFRSERNFMLNKSDRHMFWDSPLTDAKKQEWATYRQALRDLPDNTTDPRDIAWPTKPAL